MTKTSGFGIIFVIVYSFFIFDYSEQLNYSLNILIFFILIGFYDDIKNIEASSKIILMIIPTVLFINEAGMVTTLGQYKSFSLELKSLKVIFTFCCILLLTNAFNYIDGMDGLIGIISLTSLIFYVIMLPINELNFFYLS